MDANIKNCIINIGWGGWYAKGTDRLLRSLQYHGFNGDFVSFKDELPFNCPKDFGSPYNLKAYMLEYAISLGYTHILWLDCSVWAIKDPNELFDVINEQGYYAWPSGFNCAQTCSDKALEYFGINRDVAETIPDCSSSMLGLNIQHPKGKAFAELWIKAMKDGVFEGSREHDGQSEDPRFMFHRQDQSAASLIMYQLGMDQHEQNVYSSYYQAKQPESVIFTMRGM